MAGLLRVPAAPEAIERVATPLAAAAWEAIASGLEDASAQHRVAAEHGRSITRQTRLATLHFQLGEMAEARRGYEAARAALAAVPRAAAFDARTRQRSWGLMPAGDALATLEATLGFVETGAFPVRAPGDDDLDAEYVAGLLGAAHELSRYATRRATAGDGASVGVCRDGVAALQAAFLAFDFRNGPLRRKYDGLKYALRRLEDVLYELSLGGGAAPPPDGAAAAQPCLASLEAVRARMEASDAARELVIKRSRDVQKGAKQAIFACHRGDAAKAAALLDAAAAAATEILQDPALVAKWPALRGGALGAALEESPGPASLFFSPTGGLSSLSGTRRRGSSRCGSRTARSRRATRSACR